jgi:hypothetical protein
VITIDNKYNPDCNVYFISYSKLPSNISAAVYEGYLGVGFVINFHTDIIEDISCTLLTKVARNFLKSIIIGYNIKDGIEPLLERIRMRFFGHSQKSVCVIIKENFNLYKEWKKKEKNLILNEKKYCNELFEDNVLFSLEDASLYPEHSLYLISYARIPHNMSLAFFKGFTGIGFVIDFRNDIILDCCCTFITDEAKKFIKSIVVGRRIHSIEDIDDIIDAIEFSFHGPSQKALLTIVKSNYNEYCEWKEENTNILEVDEL